MISFVKKRDVWQAAEHFSVDYKDQDDAVALRTASLAFAMGFGRVALLGGKRPAVDFGPDFVVDHVPVKELGAAGQDLGKVLPSDRYDLVVVRSFQSYTRGDFVAGLESVSSLLVPNGRLVAYLDLYLTDDPSEYWVLMYESLLKSLSESKRCRSEIAHAPSLEFSCSAATLADPDLFGWRRFSPDLHKLRMEAQLVTLEVIATRSV